MSNTPDNSRPDAADSAAITVDVQSHLDEEPEPPEPSRSARVPPLPADFQARVQRVIRHAACDHGFVVGAIEVAILDDDQIRRVNARHLGHDWETDVISFPDNSAAVAADSPDVDRPEIAGELLVSWETAVREATSTGWPPLTELLLYCIHGTLHLAGMDDLDDSARQQMRRIERRLVGELQLEGWQLYDVDAQDRNARNRVSSSVDPLGDAIEDGASGIDSPSPSADARTRQ